MRGAGVLGLRPWQASSWQAVYAWRHLLASMGIALPLAYAASVLHARGAVGATVRWLVSGAAVIAGAAYGFLVYDPERAPEGWRVWLLAGAALAALLCVPLVPAGPAHAGDRRERTWRFGARLAARSAVVAACAAALWVGLALATVAVERVLEVQPTFWHALYAAPASAERRHLASVLLILLPVVAVVAGLPRLLAPPQRWREDELRLLRRLGAFVLAPVVLVALTLAYALAVRALVGGRLPKNLVSPVAIGAGLAAVLATVVLEPTHDDERARALAWLIRLAGPLVVPLALLGIWAVAIRVRQYGWTEFRYLRLLALILLALYGSAAGYLSMRRRRPPLAWLPAVLAGALVLAAIGPGSALAVARRSQAGALRQLLALAGRTGPGEKLTALPPPAYRALQTRCEYLLGHFGWDAMRESAPWLGADPGYPANASACNRRLGITEWVPAGLPRRYDTAVRAYDGLLMAGSASPGIPGLAGGTLYVFQGRGDPARLRSALARRDRLVRSGRLPADAAEPESLTVHVGGPGGRVVALVPGGALLEADLGPLMQSIIARNADRPVRPEYVADSVGYAQVVTDCSSDLALDPAEVVIPLRRSDGVATGQLVVQRLEFESGPGSATGTAQAPGSLRPRAPARLRILYANGIVLLRAGLR